MLLDDIITLCNEVARNAKVVDDEKIDRRLWQDFIMLKRNQFIKNYINEKGTLEQNTLQFELLDTEIYDPALDLGGISLGRKIVRTLPCPTIIEGRAGVAVYEMTTADSLSKTIGVVPFDRLRWVGNGVTNRHALYAAFYDGRFYIKSGTMEELGISKVRVVAVFADPTLVSTYNRDTDDYPVNDYMVEFIKNGILQTDFNVIQTTRSDNFNDGNGEIQTQGTGQ